MELSEFNLWAMILFNTAFCISLPKIVSLNWFKTLTK
ncbi:hypothetical protein Xen7305DRAFT_00000700 [Xenococcus sp. PCC 7305]|nr:hypothetical protein Xen7305DRAFT_00000700 [Xenococcus sp. PCC 7305]